MSVASRSRPAAAARLYRQHSRARRRAAQRRGVPRRLRGRRARRHYAIGGELVVMRKAANGADPLFAPDEARALAPAAEPCSSGLPRGRPLRHRARSRGDQGAEGAAAISRHRPALDRGAGPGRDRIICRRSPKPRRCCLARAASLLRQLRRADERRRGRLEARMSVLQGRAFPAHRSGGDHAGGRRRALPARPRRRVSSPACGRALRASSSRARRSRMRCAARRWRKPASSAAR